MPAPIDRCRDLRNLGPCFVGPRAAPSAARALDRGVAYVDPRLASLGARAVLPRDSAAATLTGAGFTENSAETYDRLRIGLGIADGSRDLAGGKAILLENGFDELNGIDWQKGCYMGQELTARTKYRGLVRKRLPVAIEGAARLRHALDAGRSGSRRDAEHPQSAAPGPRHDPDRASRPRPGGRIARRRKSRLRPLIPDWIKLPEQVP